MRGEGRDGQFSDDISSRRITFFPTFQRGTREKYTKKKPRRRGVVFFCFFFWLRHAPPAVGGGGGFGGFKAARRHVAARVSGSAHRSSAWTGVNSFA